MLYIKKHSIIVLLLFALFCSAPDSYAFKVGANSSNSVPITVRNSTDSAQEITVTKDAWGGSFVSSWSMNPADPVTLLPGDSQTFWVNFLLVRKKLDFVS